MNFLNPRPVLGCEDGFRLNQKRAWLETPFPARVRDLMRIIEVETNANFYSRI
jgi:hypothetical protein